MTPMQIVFLHLNTFLLYNNYISCTSLTCLHGFPIKTPSLCHLFVLLGGFQPLETSSGYTPVFLWPPPPPASSSVDTPGSFNIKFPTYWIFQTHTLPQRFRLNSKHLILVDFYTDTTASTHDRPVSEALHDKLYTEFMKMWMYINTLLRINRIRWT